MEVPQKIQKIELLYNLAMDMSQNRLTLYNIYFI